MLVGNKCDETEARELTAKEGEEQARQWSSHFMETSAKTNYNVKELFQVRKNIPPLSQRVFQLLYILIKVRKCTYKYQQDQYPTPIKVYIRHTYSSYVSAQRVNSNINFFLFCYFEKGIVRCFCCFFSFNIMAYICLAREDVRRVTSANERARQCLLFCWFNCILYTRNKLSSFLFFSQKELLSLDKNRAMSLQPDSKNKASRSASAPPGTSGAGSEKLKDKCRLM